MDPNRPAHDVGATRSLRALTGVVTYLDGHVDGELLVPVEFHAVDRPSMDRPRVGTDGTMNDEPDRALAVYLRDHFAGSSAGLALVQRCRRENSGTPLDQVLAGVEAEIVDDRLALQDMMSRLGVAPSIVKSTLGSLAEVVGRLKSNGRLFGRSPVTPVVELEGLAAGIVTKRNLWWTLREAATSRPGLRVAELDHLIERAMSQFERVVEAHRAAARGAVGSVPGSANDVTTAD